LCSTVKNVESNGAKRTSILRRRTDNRFFTSHGESETDKNVSRCSFQNSFSVTWVSVNGEQSLVQAIVQNDSLAVVDKILTNVGIVEVEGVERPADYSSDEESEYGTGSRTPTSTPLI